MYCSPCLYAHLVVVVVYQSPDDVHLVVLQRGENVGRLAGQVHETGPLKQGAVLTTVEPHLAHRKGLIIYYVCVYIRAEQCVQ